MRLTPSMPVSEDSIRCATCVSISAGAAPGRVVVTMSVGNSTFGIWLMGNWKNAISPAEISGAAAHATDHDRDLIERLLRRELDG